MINDTAGSVKVDGRRGDGDVVTVAKGAGFIAAGQMFAFAIRFVMAVLLARELGRHDYGLYILAVSVAASASSLASLGLDAAMERYVAVQVRRTDDAGTRGTVQIGVIGTVLSSFAIGIAVLVFAEPLATGLFDEPDLIPLLRLAGIVAPVVATSTLLVATIRGFKRMDLSSLTENIVQPFSRLILLLIAILIGISAFRAEVVFGLSYLLATILALRLLSRRLPGWTRLGSARRDTKEIAAFSFPFWFSGLMRMLRTRLQPLLLGIFGSVANVGVFSVVTSANMLGRVANASIRTASRPTLAELHDAGDVRELGRLYATTTRWTLAANLPVFIAMLLVPTSLLGIFGEGFADDGLTPLVIVACAEVVNAATGMCGPIIAMSAFNRMKLFNSFAWMAVSVGANVLLIPKWGIIGAAIAILVATSFINLIRVIELWVLFRILPWDRRIWKPITAAAVTAAISAFVLTYLPDELGMALLAVVLIGMAVIFYGTMFVLGLEPDDQLLLDRLRRRAGRGRRRGRTPDNEPVAADSVIEDLE